MRQFGNSSDLQKRATTSKRCFKCRLLRAATTSAVAGALLSCLAARQVSAADIPQWLRDAQQSAAANSAAPDETNAIVLWDEQETTVRPNGEVETAYRRAYLILRPGGKEYGKVAIPFDSETKITSIRGWCLPKDGKEYELKDKDAIEVGFTQEFYSDLRQKAMQIPAADPGNIIAYEYHQKSRPFILQDEWWFQSELPVRKARFTLFIPLDWEYRAYWMNYPQQSPAVENSTELQWNLENVPALRREPEMPALRAVTGRLGVTYAPPAGSSAALGPVDWQDIGKWFDGLSEGSEQATPEISQKVKDLTANATTWLDKAQAITAYVQSQVRYVAIEIGIGGFQPHAAGDIFRHQYGDCKDKATLLHVMLHEAGIDSYLALAQIERGVVNPDFASALSFNHAILAIKVPDGVPEQGLYSIVENPRLGKLLFFDPTDAYTPFGYLPSPEQTNYVLVSSAQGGELVKLPLLPPSTNQLVRRAKLQLAPDGSISGAVEEVRIGAQAGEEKYRLLNASGTDRVKILESFLGTFLGEFRLTGATAGDLAGNRAGFVLRYQFVAQSYAKSAGNLLILRPRVLGQKSSAVAEESSGRKLPVEMDGTSLDTDDFEIDLPPGYTVDDAPEPVKTDAGFASYASEIQVSPGAIHYKRSYQVNDVLVPADKIATLRRFNREVAGDENASVVLKKTQ